ncbi:energy-coupling factor transporter transmembrane protein EcfT [Clostridium algoriphilum]|uniref:energy-coupling factor transporter transmembrane component T n=1 Tax=Clostridium algoriphilum TaxID=198347 RepID=UPI001CF21E59|nr:energy-coupling factor transporter transmembrane component T [Clostridium algoriphilum]MCB2295060.1 energy-coupling factor transporter transmembrane protein EcfT [Clostridium algoriphilum]
MPEWLLKKDNYVPSVEKSTFINKSILSIIKMLTKFSYNAEHKPDRFGINTITILISAILIIIFVSLSRSFQFLMVIDVFLLLIISVLKVDEIKHIIRMVSVVTIFTVIILLPSFLMGNENNSIMILIKTIITVTVVNITSSITRWNDITKTLKLLFIPDIFILVLDITIKYIVIFGEFSLNMLYALRLRSVGKNKNKNTSISGIIGTVFIKSKEMAEEMYGAMECRGFTGEYKIYTKYRFRFNDILCIIIDIGIIGSYFYFVRV